MLSRLALMVQAAVLDGQFFDPIPPFDDGGVAAEVGVGGRDVAETLVVAATGGLAPEETVAGISDAIAQGEEARNRV